MTFNEEFKKWVQEFNDSARPDITAMVDEEPDYEVENDILQFAEEIFTYVMNELEDGDWKPLYFSMTPEEKKMLFTALSDAFGDSTED